MNKTLQRLKRLHSQSVVQFCELMMTRINDGHIVTHIYSMPTDVTYVFNDGIELSIGGSTSLDQWYIETRRLTYDEYITDINVSMYNPQTGEIIEDNNYSLKKV